MLTQFKSFELSKEQQVAVQGGTDMASIMLALQLEQANSVEAILQKQVANLKSNTDPATSQLDMINLQSMMNKYNTSVDLMTNTMQKMANTKEAIIGNMR